MVQVADVNRWCILADVRIRLRICHGTYAIFSIPTAKR